MATPLNQNQFKQVPILGELDLTINNNVISARIDPNSVFASPLVAGTVVRLTDVAGEVPMVDGAAITATPWGVIIHTMKKDTFGPGDYVNVACVGSVVYLEASAAIARGAKVQGAPAGPTVATLVANTNAMLGYSLDKPTGANQLTRIYINPGSIAVGNIA